MSGPLSCVYGDLSECVSNADGVLVYVVGGMFTEYFVRCRWNVFCAGCEWKVYGVLVYTVCEMFTVYLCTL